MLLMRYIPRSLQNCVTNIPRQQLVDRKLEPIIKRKMTEYLGELEDDDLVMFVVEHLKDKKGPHKLVEGLEPVSSLG